MTENDVTWTEMTGSDLQVASFHRKWRGEGCRRPRTQVLDLFQRLQGCNSEVSINWKEMMSRERKWREVPSKRL